MKENKEEEKLYKFHEFSVLHHHFSDLQSLIKFFFFFSIPTFHHNIT